MWFCIKKILSAKKLRFCCYYALTFNPTKSAVYAGYSDPTKSSVTLLSDKNVRQEIQDILNNLKFSPDSTAYLGYKKLAFGDISDAIKLICCDDYTQLNIDNLNLFNVAEIKKPKDNCIEIKFFDRLKALEKLQEIDNKENSASSSFYEALNKNAISNNEDNLYD